MRAPLWDTAIALTVLLLLAGPALAEDQSKYPDWWGQWTKVPDGGVPRYDPSKPIRQQEAPLKPEYRARHEASMRDQDAGGFGLDTNYACFPSTMPRTMSGITRMEFLIAPAVTHILFEHMTFAPRRIYTDGRDWPKDQEPTFLGYSIGKWVDPDPNGRFQTLEVETRNIRGPKTWDQSGMPMADDNEAVIKERLYLDKANPVVLHDELTTTDNSLTRPWSAIKSYQREKKVIWVDNTCTESNPYVTIEGQTYYLSAEGKLMPMKKDQPPPDLRYFKQVKK
ncbi:MAG TPA: hypothetical protein VGI22_01165 [Xanthobacteraceae bacterium]|jgi:hypothetical protein